MTDRVWYCGGERCVRCGCGKQWFPLSTVQVIVRFPKSQRLKPVTMCEDCIENVKEGDRLRYGALVRSDREAFFVGSSDPLLLVLQLYLL